MSDEINIKQNFITFNNSSTNFITMTKNTLDNGIMVWSSYNDGITGGNVLHKGLINPIDSQDAATKNYVDISIPNPGGSIGSVQYNNTTFSGTNEFLYDGVRTITIGSELNTSVIKIPDAITAATAGGSLNINSGNGNTSGSGGNITITAGTSPSGTDGAIILNTNATNNIVINDTTFTSLLRFLSPNGSVSEPTYSFSSDNTSGFYRGSAGSISYTSAGTEIATIGPHYGIFLSLKTNNSYGIIFGNGGQQIPIGAVTVLTNTYYNGVVTLSGDTSSDRPTYSNGVYTINLSGIYLISYQISFGAGGTGVRSTRIVVNNSTTIYYGLITANPASSVRTSMSSSAVIQLNSGDIVSTAIFQNSSIQIFTDISILGYFSIYRLG